MEPAHHFKGLEDAIRSFMPTWLNEHQRISDDTLYHYTTHDGMKGIIESRNIRLTHSTSLNDPNEIIYGQSIIDSVLNESIAHETDHIRLEILKAIQVQFDTFDFMDYDVFVACFCEKNNLLSQWRAYSDTGGGYCLGIKFTENTLMASSIDTLKNHKYLCLRKVIYGEDRQIALVEEYIRTIVPAIDTVLSQQQATDGHSPELSIMSIHAVNVLWDMLMTFKYEAYSEELEWRIIYTANRKHEPQFLQFTPVGLYSNPYRAMSIYYEQNDKLFFPIHSITYGPSLYPPRIEASLDLFIKQQSATQNSISIPEDIEIKNAGFRYRQK